MLAAHGAGYPRFVHRRARLLHRRTLPVLHTLTWRAPESICPDAAIGGTMSRVLVFRVGRRFRVGEGWGCRPLQRTKASP